VVDNREAGMADFDEYELEFLHSILKTNLDFFRHRDEMNARVHVSMVKFSPITVDTSKAELLVASKMKDANG
jgi:hypothetical protein